MLCNGGRGQRLCLASAPHRASHRLDVPPRHFFAMLAMFPRGKD